MAYGFQGQRHPEADIVWSNAASRLVHRREDFWTGRWNCKRDAGGRIRHAHPRRAL